MCVVFLGSVKLALGLFSGHRENRIYLSLCNKIIIGMVQGGWRDKGKRSWFDREREKNRLKSAGEKEENRITEYT